MEVPPTTHAGDRADAARTSAGRLEFLDALRGIAALVVALQHTAEQLWTGVLAWSHTWFRPGEFGVLVFFVCSGFIIPASLERRGSLREFWIGRAFRLWPLYLAVLAAVLVGTALSDRVSAPPGYRPVSDTLLNATMLQVFTDRPLVIGASWTLGYELAFYLLVSGLFVLGWHRQSVRLAGLFLAGALVAGSFVPPLLVTSVTRDGWGTALGLLAILAVVVMTAPGLTTQQRLVGTAFVAVPALLVANRPQTAYFALLVIGTMFVGTVLYRWTSGELSGRSAAALFGAAVAIVVLTHRLHHVGYAEPITGRTPAWWTEAATFVGAYAVFGAGLLLRRRRFPRVLVYLGTISYSVYLMHALVLVLVPAIEGQRVATFALWNALTIGLSVVTYHLIEKPAIQLGRRIARRTRPSAGTGSQPADLPVTDAGTAPARTAQSSPSGTAR